MRLNGFDSEARRQMVGQKITSIEGLEEGSEEIIITFENGGKLYFYHLFECCESVEVAQVDGNVERHIGATFVDLKEKTNEDDSGQYDSATWTFYTLITSKGYLDFRWLGNSNGYYSERVSVDFETPRKK